MKPIWLVILVISLVGNLIGGYVLYKALQLRSEARMLKKYSQDLAQKAKQAKKDFPGAAVYREANLELLLSTTPEERRNMCILYGASITRAWNTDDALPELKLINRGVGAQSSTQLLARFSSDVLQLEPGRVVLKFCSGNFNPQADDQSIWDEFETMARMADQRGIQPIIATIIPVTRRAEEFENYSMTEHIQRFNERARAFAAQNNFPVVDFYAATADDEGFLPDHMARDAIHPSDVGYEKLTEALRSVVR